MKKTEKLSNEELSFIPAHEDAVRLTPLVHWHALLWGSVFFVMVFIGWAAFAVLDEVTHAEGKVIPSARLQVVQNLEGGILKEIFVKVGELIEPGGLLLRLDDTQFSSQLRELQIHAAALDAKIARLLAESRGEALVFSSDLVKKFLNATISEENLYKAKQQELKAQLEILDRQQQQQQQELKEVRARAVHLEKRLELQQRELTMAEKLHRQGAISEVEVLRLRRAVSELALDLESSQLAQPRLESAIAAGAARVEELKIGFRTVAQAELTQAEQEQAKVLENLRTLEDRVARTLVRSPMQGVVNVIHVTTLGGIIQPGQPLVEIVPTEDHLIVEARIKPQDIGFLHLGQKAMVKLSAYDFSIYGGVPGVIINISPSTVNNENNEPSYVVQVRTQENALIARGQVLPILPGMHASVDIITGRKSVLDYLLKPILKTKDQALRER